jgi:hypothetical protein
VKRKGILDPEDFTGKFTVIPYDRKSHYSTFFNWWKYHKVFPWDSEILPRDSGVVVLYKGLPVSAGWFYVSVGAPLSILGPLVTRPRLGRKIRDYAIYETIKSIMVCSKEAECSVLYACSGVPGIIKRLLKLGFKSSDRPVLEMVGKL